MQFAAVVLTAALAQARQTQMAVMGPLSSLEAKTHDIIFACTQPTRSSGGQIVTRTRSRISFARIASIIQDHTRAPQFTSVWDMPIHSARKRPVNLMFLW
eukprot:10328413-Karenia_brevis.AAC.1